MEQHSTAIDTNDQAAYLRLLNDWLATWNGDYTRADDIISPDFRVHAALLGDDDRAIEGPDGLVEWIAQIRAAYTELVFTVEVGPIVDRDHLAFRWIAVGTYGGGFPAATAPAGTAIRFTGIDMLRIEQEQIAEYWVNSDTHVLLATLGVHA
ncbi:ester cyclase [Nocardia sp. NPDC060256]|uniref:ester cyclase n=1 Tax=unclassified Nocardia TaxID=2637762 RepID=UPI0036495995